MLCNAWVCAAVCLCVFAFWQDELAVKSQSKHTLLTVENCSICRETKGRNWTSNTLTTDGLQLTHICIDVGQLKNPNHC